MALDDERHETVLRLYPIFKEEVYRRRNEMMRWTAIGAGSLVAILNIVLLVPAAHSLSTTPRLLLACATLLLALTYMGIIWQQHHRHQQAKQQLIKIEQAMGLFGGLPGHDDHALYPDDWQNAWTHDSSLLQYLAVLTLLTSIVLVAILLPSL
ncbi:hypothetical protein [Nitrospira lenta]|uniref:Uncharacterized protein n=1 Tax=Nitrospira lenta TaxID=1436998 RepID=A0A330L0B8_9BACT|nr:hypothetical protein [Nitrospira lenta]SPP63208.1 membrane hypothetical protein [Nitrospira lenta]